MKKLEQKVEFVNGTNENELKNNMQKVITKYNEEGKELSLLNTYKNNKGENAVIMIFS